MPPEGRGVLVAIFLEETLPSTPRSIMAGEQIMRRMLTNTQRFVGKLATRRARCRKAAGYADLYISLNDTPFEDITITLFRGARPVALFKKLGNCVEETDVKGVYDVKNWKTGFPIRIVVTTELEGREYAGFRAISKKPDISDIQQIIDEVRKEPDENVKKWYRDYLELFSRLDSETLEEAKRRDPDMARDYREIFGFDVELQQSEARGADKAKRDIIENMFRRGKSSEEIADLCGCPLSLVKEVEQSMLVVN